MTGKEVLITSNQGRLWAKKLFVQPEGHICDIKLPEGNQFSSFGKQYFVATNVSQRGDIIANVDNRGNVIIIRVQRNRYVRLDKGGSRGTLIAFGLQSRCELFVAFRDCTIRCYNLDSGVHQATLKGHKRPAHSICPPKGGHMLVSASSDSLIVWNTQIPFNGLLHQGNPNTIQSYMKKHSISDLPHKILQAQVSPDDSQIVVLLKDCSIRTWSKGTLKPGLTLVPPMPNNCSQVHTCMAVCPHSNLLVAGGSSPLLTVWQLVDGTLKCVIHMPTKYLHAVSISFSSNGRSVVVLCNDGSVRVIDVIHSQLNYTHHPQSNTQLAKQTGVDSKGRLLSCTCSDGVVRLYDLHHAQDHSDKGVLPLRRTDGGGAGRLVCGGDDGGQEDEVKDIDVIRAAQQVQLPPQAKQLQKQGRVPKSGKSWAISPPAVGKAQHQEQGYKNSNMQSNQTSAVTSPVLQDQNEMPQNNTSNNVQKRISEQQQLQENNGKMHHGQKQRQYEQTVLGDKNNWASTNYQNQPENSIDRKHGYEQRSKDVGGHSQSVVPVDKAVDWGQGHSLVKNSTNTRVRQLNQGKLLKLLRQHGTYSAKYRPVIWSFLLQCPDDEKAYKYLTARGIHASYQHFVDKSYSNGNQANQILNTSSSIAGRLARVLSCIAHWAPVLGEVGFMSNLAYPFVKLYEKQEHKCVEALIYFVLKYANAWFHAFPHPPVRVLSQLESLLGHHDPDVKHHLDGFPGASGKVVWDLLSSLMTEVLDQQAWYMVMDHVLSSSHTYLLTIPLAYLRIHRAAILKSMDTKALAIITHNNINTNTTLLLKTATALHRSSPEVLLTLAQQPRMDGGHTPYTDMTKQPLSGAYPALHHVPQGKVQMAVAERLRDRRHVEAMAARREQIRELEIRNYEVECAASGWQREQEMMEKFEQEKREEMKRQAFNQLSQQQQLDEKEKRQRLRHIELLEQNHAAGLCSVKAMHVTAVKELEDEIDIAQQQLAFETLARREAEGIVDLEFKVKQNVVELQSQVQGAAAKQRLKQLASARMATLQAKVKSQTEAWKNADTINSIRTEQDIALRMQAATQAQEQAATAQAERAVVCEEINALQQLQDMQNERAVRIVKEHEQERAISAKQQAAQKRDQLSQKVLKDLGKQVEEDHDWFMQQGQGREEALQIARRQRADHDVQDTYQSEYQEQAQKLQTLRDRIFHRREEIEQQNEAQASAVARQLSQEPKRHVRHHDTLNDALNDASLPRQRGAQHDVDPVDVMVAGYMDSDHRLHDKHNLTVQALNNARAKQLRIIEQNAAQEPGREHQTDKGLYGSDGEGDSGVDIEHQTLSTDVEEAMAGNFDAAVNDARKARQQVIRQLNREMDGVEEDRDYLVATRKGGVRWQYNDGLGVREQVVEKRGKKSRRGGRGVAWSVGGPTPPTDAVGRGKRVQGQRGYDELKSIHEQQVIDEAQGVGGICAEVKAVNAENSWDSVGREGVAESWVGASEGGGSGQGEGLDQDFQRGSEGMRERVDEQERRESGGGTGGGAGNSRQSSRAYNTRDDNPSTKQGTQLAQRSGQRDDEEEEGVTSLGQTNEKEQDGYLQPERRMVDDDEYDGIVQSHVFDKDAYDKEEHRVQDLQAHSGAESTDEAVPGAKEKADVLAAEYSRESFGGFASKLDKEFEAIDDMMTQLQDESQTIKSKEQQQLIMDPQISTQESSQIDFSNVSSPQPARSQVDQRDQQQQVLEQQLSNRHQQSNQPRKNEYSAQNTDNIQQKPQKEQHTRNNSGLGVVARDETANTELSLDQMNQTNQDNFNQKINQLTNQSLDDGIQAESSGQSSLFDSLLPEQQQKLRSLQRTESNESFPYFNPKKDDQDTKENSSRTKKRNISDQQPSTATQQVRQSASNFARQTSRLSNQSLTNQAQDSSPQQSPELQSKQKEQYNTQSDGPQKLPWDDIVLPPSDVEDNAGPDLPDQKIDEKTLEQTIDNLVPISDLVKKYEVQAKEFAETGQAVLEQVKASGFEARTSLGLFDINPPPKIKLRSHIRSYEGDSSAPMSDISLSSFDDWHSPVSGRLVTMASSKQIDSAAGAGEVDVELSLAGMGRNGKGNASMESVGKGDEDQNGGQGDAAYTIDELKNMLQEMDVGAGTKSGAK